VEWDIGALVHHSGPTHYLSTAPPTPLTRAPDNEHNDMSILLHRYGYGYGYSPPSGEHNDMSIS